MHAIPPTHVCFQLVSKKEFWLPPTRKLHASFRCHHLSHKKYVGGTEWKRKKIMILLSLSENKRRIHNKETLIFSISEIHERIRTSPLRLHYYSSLHHHASFHNIHSNLLRYSVHSHSITI